MEKNDNSLQMEVVYSPPYTGRLFGEIRDHDARWFEQTGSSGEVLGIVWTDDKESMGFLALAYDNDAQAENLKFRQFFNQKNFSASQAFDAMTELEEDARDDFEILTGKLFKMLDKYESDVAAQGPDSTPIAASPHLSSQPTTSVTPPSHQRPDDSYGITVADDGETVLELVLINTAGTFLRRDGAWEPVDLSLDEEDYPTLYNVEWHDVDRRIVGVFEEKRTKKTLTKESFIPFFLQ